MVPWVESRAIVDAGAMARQGGLYSLQEQVEHGLLRRR